MKGRKGVCVGGGEGDEEEELGLQSRCRTSTPRTVT